MKVIQHFVDGKKFLGDSKRVGKVFNPATGEQSAEVKLASIKDVSYAEIVQSTTSNFNNLFFTR